MLKGFLKKSRSAADVSAAQKTSVIVLDNTGSIISSSKLSIENEIDVNGCINTIISKQSSIVNEASLSVEEEKDNAPDIKTTNLMALFFLKRLNNPNSIPSPSNKNELFINWIEEYYKSGLFGAVFTFDRDNVSIKNCKNITLPKKIAYGGLIGNAPYYNINMASGLSLVFKWNPELLNFSAKDADNTYLLFVSGKFEIKDGVYKSIFQKQSSYVIFQNQLINFVNSFHKQACFPSMMVQISYKNLDSSEHLSAKQQADFDAAVEKFKKELDRSKSADEAGKIITASNPYLDVKVTPLSIPTNASDNSTYQTLISDKLYSFVDGGSSAAFEGKNEYSNNASAKLQDLYDGSFRMAQAVIIEPLTKFMQNLLLLSKVANYDKFRITLDKSVVQIYQNREINQIIALTQGNLITINNGRQRLSKISDSFSDLQPIKQGDVLFKELGGTSEAKVTVSN